MESCTGLLFFSLASFPFAINASELIVDTQVIQENCAALPAVAYIAIQSDINNPAWANQNCTVTYYNGVPGYVDLWVDGIGYAYGWYDIGPRWEWRRARGSWRSAPFEHVRPGLVVVHGPIHAGPVPFRPAGGHWHGR